MEKVDTVLTSPVTTEIDQYLSEHNEPPSVDTLLYWKAHQNKQCVLDKLASSYLQVPASSASVECLSSVAGKVFRPDRCMLKDTTFERLMFIKCNQQLLDRVS